MAAIKFTLSEIFDSNFETAGTEVRLDRITIPIIQRDYAQGRKDPDINRVRTKFLDSCYNALMYEPITLDFIYGDLDESGIMTPLDGQQRLTTLFLLHWYAAKKEDINSIDYDFLRRFSYETRYSARDFTQRLIDYTPIFEGGLAEEIIDQSWFPLDWKKDSTISSMLVVLDDIANKFKNVPSMWSKLTNNKAISFYFLPIRDMGLTDELYIKMNSRGRPLTQFEHFKAELESELKKADIDLAKRIIYKFDQDWNNMIWSYRDDSELPDDKFLNYFRFICDVISYKRGETLQGKSRDEFDLLKQFFSFGRESFVDNVLLLESYYDCWKDLPNGEVTSEFFEVFLTKNQSPSKVKVESRYDKDVFGGCLKNNINNLNTRNRQFPLNRMILLYAFVVFLQEKNNISYDDFSRRLRIVNNLIQNSDDEISDSEQRSSGNRMPAILHQVDNIILKGEVELSITNGFNKNQYEEEAEKIQWLIEHSDKTEQLFRLEDHELLNGQISVVGLENYHHFERFHSLFSCDWDNVDCALMTIGYYGQEENSWRSQLGSAEMSKAWSNLFHKSSSKGFERTKNVLNELLSLSEVIDDNLLINLKEEYLLNCEHESTYDWRYYYLKYKVFRPGSYGKYHFPENMKNPYRLGILLTQSKFSQSSYQPFLKIVDSERLSRDHNGHRIILNNQYITCENDGYYIYDELTKEVVEKVLINQNDENIDTENRIEKMLVASF